ncbi:MAG: hypothetical protein KDK25_00540 [Leptospiraceae bacterium]|nr:hypothetical protein [Leptospiraceae bacterium]
MDLSKLSGLPAWEEEPSFFERHRVNTYIEANMETVFEDWSQMKLEQTASQFRQSYLHSHNWLF